MRKFQRLLKVETKKTFFWSASAGRILPFSIPVIDTTKCLILIYEGTQRDSLFGSGQIKVYRLGDKKVELVSETESLGIITIASEQVAAADNACASARACRSHLAKIRWWKAKL